MIAGVVSGGRPLSPDSVEVAHTHWRVNVTKTQAGSYISFGEIEMAATVGGADQCSGGSSAPASTELAFDNNTATAWWRSTLPQWVSYSFTAPVYVASIRITAEHGYAAGVTASPENFTVEHSDDGISWTVAGSWTGQVGWTALEVRTFNL